MVTDKKIAHYVQLALDLKLSFSAFYFVLPVNLSYVKYSV